MQIHRQNSVRACCYEQIRYQLRCDRVSGFGFSVLPCIAIIRNDGVDPAGRCALHGIDHDQELHQIVVDRIAGRLDDVNIQASDCFPDVDGNFAIAEFGHRCSAQWFPHDACNFFS